MTMRNSFLSALMVFGLLLAPSLTKAAAEPEAGSASETVKKTVDQVRQTVSESEGQVSADELDQKLRDIIAPVFDFREMSRRSLGANWKKATPEQQNEFVGLFSELLARNYLKKIRENVASSAFKLLGEKNKGKKALVQTMVEYGDDTASIDYRMRQKDEGWRVYDVVVENIGLVSNYRSEFAGIVKKEKITGLIERLKSKQ